MNDGYKELGRAVGLLSCLVTAGLALAEEDDTTLEEVIVLGSHIPRADYTGISPVFTIDREELKIDGRKTIAEVLNRYPQFHGGRNAGYAHLGSRTGATPVNLRNLGSSRTLVLLNGHRLGPAGATQGVDINTLPVGLVQRVETLTGGASSSYGADAMAGVVNFTLRDQVDGLEFEASAGRTDRGDGDTANVSALGGLDIAEGRVQLTGYLNYFDRDSVSRGEREFSAESLAENVETGELVVMDSPSIPAGYALWPAQVGGEPAPDGLTFDKSGNPRPFTEGDFYNTNLIQDLIIEEQRLNFGGFATVEVNETTRFRLGLVLADNEANVTLAPTPLFYDNLLINLDNPLLTDETRQALADSYDPLGIGLVFPGFNYRVTALGNRERDYERNSTWLSLELDGNWLQDWSWNMAYTLSDFDMRLEERGGASSANLQQALLVNPVTGECLDPAGGCAPADVFGPDRLSSQAAEFVSIGELVSREESRQQVISVRTAGAIALFSGLDTGVALGLEWREDEVDYRPDPRLAEGYNGFWYSPPVKGNQNVAEIYGEVLQPLAEDRAWAQGLDLELGLRYSDYSNVGGEWTWKTGLNWELNSSLRFRGGYQRASRAPNLDESYRSPVEVPLVVQGQFILDPCAASQRPQDVPGRIDLCLSQGISPENLSSYEPAPLFTRTEVAGGNEDLGVEKADTYSLGVAWTPPTLSGLALSLDYYEIDIDDAILPVGTTASFGACFLQGLGSQFCEGIERVPEGDVSRTRGTFYNLGGLKTKGYDLNISYQVNHMAPWNWPSSLTISSIINKVDSLEADLGRGTIIECAGNFGDPCSGVNPEHRALSRLRYQTGAISTALTWRWLDSVSLTGRIAPDGPPYSTAVQKLDSQNYLDFALSWQVNDSLSLNFDTINLTDNEPPILGDYQTSPGVNTDPGTYDVLGRRYQLGLTLSL